MNESAQSVSGNGPKYTVAVRTLCEFTAKQGDLDLRRTRIAGPCGHHP